MTLASKHLQANRDCLPEPTARRCEHVVRKNARVTEAVEAMEADDLEAVGHLFDDSHRSLRDLYEVSCPQLDPMVEMATEVPGVLASLA